MIVRVLGEGLIDLPDAVSEQIDKLDSDLEIAMESGDENLFHQALDALLDAIETAGKPVPSDTIVTSDVVVPGRHTTIAELQELLADTGASSDTSETANLGV